jgi:hypothetical protein
MRQLKSWELLRSMRMLLIFGLASRSMARGESPRGCRPKNQVC